MRSIARVTDEYGRGDMRFAVVGGRESVAQRATMRILFWAGTWFADTREGVPYLTTPIVGRHVDPALAAEAITEELRGVDDVTDVLAVEYEQGEGTRGYRYAARLVTPFGEVALDQPLVEPVPLPYDGPLPNRPATGEPLILGLVRVGQALAAFPDPITDPDGTADAVFAYQWQRDGVDIAGATAAAYVPVRDDEGRALRVVASFDDDRGFAESRTSAAALVGTPRYDIPLGAATATDDSRVWQDLADGIADISALRADAGPAVMVRFEVMGAADGDATNRCTLRVVAAADGSQGTTAGPELRASWETAPAAITIAVDGLNALGLSGPDYAGVATRDSSEPYAWVPGADYTSGAVTYTDSAGDAGGLAAWVADYDALTDEQKATARMILADAP